MARGMPRRKCAEITLGVAMVQIALTFVLLWYYQRNKSAETQQDSRLLLSVEYNSASAVDMSMTKRILAAASPFLSNPEPSSNEGASMSAQASNDVISMSEFETFLDKSHRFKTKMFVAPASKWETLSERRVCLAAQTSIDRLHWLLETVDRWSGPISIALFTPDIEYHISTVFLSYLRRCYPKVRDQVSFHFTFPLEHPIKESKKLSEIVGDMSCDDPKRVLDFLLQSRSQEMMLWRESLEYPQNLLRNLAKSGCQTEFTFVPDIDMIPYPGLDLELDQFLASEEVSSCKLCAYVVPTYEISTSCSKMPENKTELLMYVKEKNARKFHEKVYTINQKSSNLSEWQKLGQAEKMAVAYKVTQYIFKYEPLYVARADSPQFDERFVGFGMTRNTQVKIWIIIRYHEFRRENC